MFIVLHCCDIGSLNDNYVGEGSELFDVMKDENDKSKATIYISESFNFDSLPAEAGQISFFVQVKFSKF